MNIEQGISNIEHSQSRLSIVGKFDIRYSLFDIRYSKGLHLLHLPYSRRMQLCDNSIPTYMNIAYA